MDTFLPRHPLRLLQISNDQPLASSRSMLLRAAGWHTNICTTRDLAPSTLDGYDLLLFCQTVSSQLVRGIASTLKARNVRSTGLLRIAWGNDAAYDARYRTLIAPVSPKELIESVRCALPAAGGDLSNLPGRGLLTTKVELLQIARVRSKTVSVITLH